MEAPREESGLTAVDDGVMAESCGQVGLGRRFGWLNVAQAPSESIPVIVQVARSRERRVPIRRHFPIRRIPNVTAMSYSTSEPIPRT